MTVTTEKTESSSDCISYWNKYITLLHDAEDRPKMLHLVENNNCLWSDSSGGSQEDLLGPDADIEISML